MSFCAEFKLDNKNDIVHFFPLVNNNICGYLQSLKNRIIHLFEKHVWINEEKLFAWVENHPDESISDLFKETRLYKKIRRYENHMSLPEKSFWEHLKDGLLFLWRFIKSPGSIGAVLPSSDRLAKAIVRQIPNTPSDQKRYILEVGPGTGVFSEKILKRMNPNDELHLVEFDHDFCEELRSKFAHIPNIKIYEGSIADFNPQTDFKMPPDKKYNFVVSGLPFNAFEKPFVEQVLNKYVNLTEEGGHISYFEYFFLPAINKLFMNQSAALNLEHVLQVKNDFYNKYGENKDRVWINFPPATVLHHAVHKTKINNPNERNI